MRDDLRPWAATVLSFMIAGLGHLYLGKYVKGLFFIFLELAAYFGLENYPDIFLVLTFVLEIWVSYDAYMIALRDKQKPDAGKPEIMVGSTGVGLDKEKKDIYVRP
jgi:hypothetical protein